MYRSCSRFVLFVGLLVGSAGCAAEITGAESTEVEDIAGQQAELKAGDSCLDGDGVIESVTKNGWTYLRCVRIVEEPKYVSLGTLG